MEQFTTRQNKIGRLIQKELSEFLRRDTHAGQRQDDIGHGRPGNERYVAGQMLPEHLSV